MDKDRKYNRKTVFVKCDCCGKMFEKVASEVKRNAEKGRHNYCSRECVGKAVTNRQTGSKRGPASEKALSHIKDICGNRRDDLTPYRYTYRCVKRRFQDVDITIEDLVEQWEKQKGICPYSGYELILPENGNVKNIDFFHRASLDRIDSSKGYVKGNIQFVSTPINLMKLTKSDEEVKNFLMDIAKFLTKKPQD
jgi:hypothetical protein